MKCPKTKVREKEGSFTFGLDRRKLRDIRRRRAATCCAAIFASTIPRCFGKCTCNWPKSRRPLKISRAISPCGPSTSRRTPYRSPYPRGLPGILPACHPAPQVALKAPGLTPRSLIEQLCAIQMLDVHFPTTDGRTLIFERYTAPTNYRNSCWLNSTWNCPSISAAHHIQPQSGTARA